MIAEIMRQAARLRSTDIARARRRIEEQRDASRQSASDPSQSHYQQDLAAARGWAFAQALQLIDDETAS